MILQVIVLVTIWVFYVLYFSHCRVEGSLAPLLDFYLTPFFGFSASFSGHVAQFFACLQ